MSQRSIILPSGPSLLVHKGWRRSRKKANAAITAADAEHEKSDSPGDIAVAVFKHPFTRNLDVPSVLEGDKAGLHQGTEPTLLQDFQFINTTDPSKTRNKDVRKLVRSHVMKKVGRIRNTTRFERESGSIGSRRTTKRNLPLPLTAGGLQGEITVSTSLTLPPICPGSATALYGAALPFTLDHHLYNLLDYCKSKLARGHVSASGFSP